MAVFGAAVSYVLMMLSHIVLRSREPDMERPYRTPGGVLTSGVALVLAMAAVLATFLVDPLAAGIMLGVYLLFVLYFALYSRHHLVASAPEEEFAAVEQAEAGLAGADRANVDARGAEAGGEGRRGRYRAARDLRHAGPPPGQAPDRPPLPGRGG